ncbi:hypothetical protein M8818_006950 [Zalaria obscura]|uniref:Uncharacterized protein n=1 Tax=Zalaria obscura TaxID=2024903 RepID=A0ACC3S604_9PEZI
MLLEPDISDDEHIAAEGAAPEGLAPAPIRSLYEVTGPSALPNTGMRGTSGHVLEPDFVTRGIVTLAEAEQLTKLYLARLDPFFYHHLQNYSNLAEIRKASTLLTVTICIVAALHDPLGSEAYEKLSTELRSVVSSLMFRHRLGLDDIKALCMASYWLPDMTWILSALTLRKAISMQYHTAHLSQPAGDEHSFHRSQMWLLIYLSNEQISILQGAPLSTINRSLINWRAHMNSAFSSEGDLRLTSHIDLLLILGRARELFGLDPRKPVPEGLTSSIHDIIAQIDEWGRTWSGRLARNQWLGDFPSEAVRLHWQFARFYICSYAFRGLNLGHSGPAPMPTGLRDIAHVAISTANSILDLLIESEPMRACLVGVPHYFHTMFAFAVVFLLKVATRYREFLDIDVVAALETSKRVLQVFQQRPAARQHLVHRISKGLKDMIEQAEKQVVANGHKGTELASGAHPLLASDNIDQDSLALPPDMAQWLDLDNGDFLSMPLHSWNWDLET